MYYREEEPGCGVYYTNDSSGEYFPERYCLDSYEDCEYFRAIEEAAVFVSRIVGKTILSTENDIARALDDYVERQEDEDVWYSFHAFEVVE